MKRLIIALLLILIAQFIYFSYQVDQIKEVVTNNADTANYRANANVTVWLQTQDQLNQLKKSIASMSAYIK